MFTSHTCVGIIPGAEEAMEGRMDSKTEAK